MKNIPNVSLGKLPYILEQIERTDLHKLLCKLGTVNREIPPRDDNSTGTITWLSIASCFLKNELYPYKEKRFNFVYILILSE